jgi:predicted DNA-binding transcriptional regulator YafY
MPSTSPSPDTTAMLVQAAASSRRLRLRYRLGPGEEREMDVDPWAVVVRHGRWYLLCWSHAKVARRVLRVDKVLAVDVLPQTFEQPQGLDPVRTLEEHLAEGWRYDVEVVIDAPLEAVAARIRRNLGRLEAIDSEHTRLVATTDEPDWYAEHLAAIRAPFRVLKPVELREATRTLGRRLLAAADGADGPLAG